MKHNLFIHNSLQFNVKIYLVRVQELNQIPVVAEPTLGDVSGDIFQHVIVPFLLDDVVVNRHYPDLISHVIEDHKCVLVHLTCIIPFTIFAQDSLHR